jgi:tetratricopeptide (TPR) repeat protein
MRYAQQGLRVSPDQSDLRIALGNARMRKRDFSGAASEFEAVLKAQPNNQIARYRLGLAQANLYMSQNKPDRAIQVINQQIRDFPDQNEPYETLGQIYLAQKNYAKAEESFRKALTIDKNSLRAYGLLGQLFMIQKSQDKAIQEFTNALKVNPKFIQAHILMATIYESKNDREKAKSHYREALKINPESPVAANNLAWILAESGSNLDEALKLAQTAARELRDNPAVQDTLGWVYYKKGSYRAAIDTLKECVRQDPKSAVYQYHLGMAYLKNGENANAKASLSEALKLSQSFPGVEEAKQALAKL